MTDYGRDHDGNLDAVRSDGTAFAHVAAAGGVTLGVATYYFPLGTARGLTPAQVPLVAVHLKWAAAVAATITVETCNFGATIGAAGMPMGGPADVTDYSATAGDWIAENPSTAYVGVVGAGNSATGLTITAGGAAAGGCMIHLGNLGARRARLKVVTTVGGVVRVNVQGKAGA